MKDEENPSLLYTGLRKWLRGVILGGMWILLVALVTESNHQNNFFLQQHTYLFSFMEQLIW